MRTAWLKRRPCPAWLGILSAVLCQGATASEPVRVGLAEADITPKIGDRTIFLAGFGHNRKAQGVNDPLLARAIVFQHGQKKLALVSVDLVGLFNAAVERVRQQLPGFHYVLVSSTHNHEGPDTLGLWGATPFTSGVDRAYGKEVEAQIVRAVRAAEQAARPVRAEIGTAQAPELLHDNRLPQVKHDQLVALRFVDLHTDRNVGVLVQWNCHPETLGDKNTQISADFVGYTVNYVQDQYRCPVIYFTGTVGGLLTSLRVEIKDEKGNSLADGTFAKTRRYGQLVGRLAKAALNRSQPLRLTPLQVNSRQLFLPMDNKLYWLGWKLGLLDRQVFSWADEVDRAEAVDPKKSGQQRLALRTELAWLRLGDLNVAAIPGEIYPELVLARVQDPADPGADFPQAPMEPGIYSHLPGPHRLLIGLANDEIGYIIPKRQWDEKPPFCYGRRQTQYGEINSLGPETAPLLCQAFRELTAKTKASSP